MARSMSQTEILCRVVVGSSELTLSHRLYCCLPYQHFHKKKNKNRRRERICFIVPILICTLYARANPNSRSSSFSIFFSSSLSFRRQMHILMTGVQCAHCTHYALTMRQTNDNENGKLKTRKKFIRKKINNFRYGKYLQLIVMPILV